MSFLSNNWFSLIVSITIAFVITISNKPIEFSNKSYFYFGVELLILAIVSFLVIKLIDLLFSLVFS